MYKLPHFTETNTEKIFSFIEENAMATVVGFGNDYPVASQLPLALKNEGYDLYLHGHLMRKTDHHLAFEKNKNVLVVFNSLPAYITAEWYDNPASASTVNYIQVQIKGCIQFLDYDATVQAVKMVTDKYVGENNTASFDKMSNEYINSNVAAIVGFKILVKEMNATFKLSQNKSAEEQKNIINKLEERNNFGDKYIAQKMKNNL